MLLDLVGGSLIAKAPYAQDAAKYKELLKGSYSQKHSMPANARAGSMKAQVTDYEEARGKQRTNN